MLQFSQRLGLDLADALPGHRELLADFLQRVVPGTEVNGLFDHLIGTGKQHLGNIQTQRLGRL